MSSFGERLQRLRKTRRLTQLQLGLRTELDPSQISEYEHDRTMPRIQTIERLAAALRVSVDELVNGIKH